MRTTSALTLTPAPHPDLSLQRLSPSLNASLFFAALRDANAPRAAELSQARVVRGLWKQALLLAARRIAPAATTPAPRAGAVHPLAMSRRASAACS